MIVIPITNLKHGDHNLYIDGEDFDKIKDYKWRLSSRQYGGHYAVTTILKNNQQRLMSIHRLIMNCPDGMVVDHINHNKLDNRKENLRICTHRNNTRNRTKYTPTISKYKGISYDGRRISNLIVRIVVDSKCIYVGSFIDEIEAAKAYNVAAKKYFGEYALLNVIP